jgi:SNF2 family DNA or RNA helicase
MIRIFSEQQSLVVIFEKTGNNQSDFDIKVFFENAGFTESNISDNEIKFTYNEKQKISEKAYIVIDFFKQKFPKIELKISDDILKQLESNFPGDYIFLSSSIENGNKIKENGASDVTLSKLFKRKLFDFQKLSVSHLLAVNNAANFSVPGSGKTTMTFAAIATWLEDETIEKIMVISPYASIIAWEEEFQLCFGRKSNSVRAKGDLVAMLPFGSEKVDIVFTHYQTANARRDDFRKFLEKYKTVLIIDESHNIKNPEIKKWASAALYLAQFAKRRIILSGTPMPNDAQDLWTQITFLYPTELPLGSVSTYTSAVKKRGLTEQYQNVLNSLYTRVKKSDLNLPEPRFIQVPVELGKHQREIYDAIAEKALDEIEGSVESAQLARFRLGRFVRLLQIASNPSLLYEMSSEFNVDNPLFESSLEQLSAEFGLEIDEISNDDLKTFSIFDKISKYSEIEIPSKIVTAGKIARELYEKGEKVIIWSSFLLNIDIFKETVLSDLNPIAINGRVSRNIEDTPNREELINRFKNSKNPEILIATPASLGESVSLHKNLQGETVCKNAIYFDRNFNGAQFMQSVDRIHRIGMEPDTEVTYHLCMGIDTIDERIHTRLLEKWQNMTNALNDNFLSTIDFDVMNETQDEFSKDYESLVEHLRSLKDRRNHGS